MRTKNCGPNVRPPRVVERVGDVASLEALLTDEDGRHIATATAVARVIALADAGSAV
jgi:hypothetical protein